MLTQHTMLHDLFTIGVNGKTSGVWKHLMPTVDVTPLVFYTKDQFSCRFTNRFPQQAKLYSYSQSNTIVQNTHNESTFYLHCWESPASTTHLYLQLCSKLFNPPDIFPLTSIVNKSCNIERCVKSMRPIFQNKIVSQGLERILSIYRRTTMSGQPPLS